MPRPLPPPSSDAFSLDVKKPRARALLIHGYTGTPYEMLPLGLALQEAGIASTGIVLPGHEHGDKGDPHALNKVRWQDWAQAAERACDDIDDDVPLVVAGCSMGALVALHLCATRPERVDAAILLAVALRYFADGKAGAFAAERGLWRVVPYVKKANGCDVADAKGKFANPCLPVLPLRGVAELAKMQTAIEAVLPSVRAPLCLFHGAGDHTIPPIASEIVARRVASERVEHHVLRDSFHVVGLDNDRDALAALAISFLDEILERRAAA